MVAITVKYIGPTNYRGSRLKAYTCNGHSVTIPYPYELSNDDKYRSAANALVKKMGWNAEGGLCGGHIKDGMVFVFCNHQEA